MYFDHEQAAYENKCRDKYNEFVEKLRTSKNEDDEMLYRHIMKLERNSAEMKEKISDFHKFFEMLQRLLPRQSSIHDVIRWFAVKN